MAVVLLDAPWGLGGMFSDVVFMSFIKKNAGPRSDRRIDRCVKMKPIKRNQCVVKLAIKVELLRRNFLRDQQRFFTKIRTARPLENEK